MPRVLMMSQEVHPVPPLKGAAVEQWMDAVAHRLDGYEPHLVSVPHPARPDDECQGNVHYRRIRMGRLYKRLFRKLTRLDPYSYVDRVLAYARAVAPSIVHIHNAPQFVDALSAGLPESRLILHMHNEKSDVVRSTVDALVGCSDYVRCWYQSRHFPARCYEVIDNGVDLAVFTGMREHLKLSALRSRYGIPADRFIVLYVGRISPEKGPDLLVQAMQQLDSGGFHLVLVGEWPEGSPEHNGRVRYARSVRHLLESVPHTVIGTVAPGEMAQMYLLGDLLMIPSRFEEPFSMVAIEAMASRLPVMALKKGGMVEYMRDGYNALLLDADAGASDIADAIGQAARQSAHLERLGQSARLLVEERFSWEKVARQTEALYRRVLSGSVVS